MKPAHFDALEAIGITRTDALILQCLRNNIRRQERIADTIGVTQPTISRRLDVLIRMGIVKFTREDGIGLSYGWSGTMDVLKERAKALNLEINASIQTFRLSNLTGHTVGELESEQPNDAKTNEVPVSEP